MRLPAWTGLFFYALSAAARVCAQPADTVAIEERYRAAGNWLSYDRDNTGRRFSPLQQINIQNIKDLVVDWVFQFPAVPFRSEVTPLARDGVLYITVGGAQAFALDGRSGREIWRFDYLGDGSAAGGDKRSWNRGFAISGNRLLMGTDDCHLLALDSRGGHLLWKTLIADEGPCFGATASPLIVKNLALIGVRGGDTGRLRGFLDAYDVETGERAWRTYTVPEPGKPGSETWPDNDSWKVGGGAPWTTGSYDPELDLLYWPTGNPGPKDFDGRDREGDNLYTGSLLAIKPDTGRIAWHYQFNPHDEHDWDSNETPLLVDAGWNGQPRKLVLHADRNEFFYVLDRKSGELLLGEPFAKQTWAKRILPNGRPEYTENALPTPNGQLVCPDIHGGTNWHAPAYHPATELFYVSARDACGVYYRTGQSIDHDLTEARQFLRAIDIHTGKIRWEAPFLGDESQNVNHAGAMTTAGGLVFFSSREGNFIAADAKTGELLWGFNTGGNIRASPMTYEAAGRQYVAITSKNGIFAFALHDQSPRR